MTPNKDGKSTSSYLVTLIAMALTTLMPFILAWWNEYSRSLPENSWLAIIAPVISAAFYVVSRTAQQNSARTTEARIEEAKAQTIIEVKKAETVGALPSLPDGASLGGAVLGAVAEHYGRRATDRVLQGVGLGQGSVERRIFSEVAQPDLSDVDETGYQFADEEQAPLLGAIDRGRVLTPQ